MLNLRSFVPGLAALLLVSLISPAALAAPTGYVDGFGGPLAGWGENNTYQLNQDGGILTVNVNKSTKWQGLYLDLGGEHDFADQPYVNLRLKATEPCVLHVYMVDAENNNTLQPRKVRAVDGYVTLMYDLSGAEGVDLSRVKAMIFTVNGAANSWTGTLMFEELRVGSEAKNLAGIEGVHDQQHYVNTGRQQVRLTGLHRVDGFEVRGGETLLRNARVSDVKDGQALLRYDLKPDATGQAKVTVTAKGAGDVQPNAVDFTVTVEGNQPPTLDAIEDRAAQVGVEQAVRLTGLSDGNVAAEQPLRFEIETTGGVVHAEQAVVDHEPFSPYATLRYTPRQAGRGTLTVIADDGARGDSTVRRSFVVRAVPDWNHAPSVDAVADQKLFVDADAVPVRLMGLDDGDPGVQPLAIRGGSSDPKVVRVDRVIHHPAATTATLMLVPGETPGRATITVTVADDGGTPRNNGDRQTSISFDAVTRVRPLKGLAGVFADYQPDAWRVEGGLSVERIEQGGQPVLQVNARDKNTFNGLWFECPDLDLSELPYLTVDIKLEDPMDFNVYFYDGGDRRNDGAGQTQRVEAGRWTTVTFDFSGDGQMADREGTPIQSDWISGVLFNFHPKLSWPFTRYDGTILLRNLRIGTRADVPQRRPRVAMDAIADRVHLVEAGPQTITITGLDDGAGGEPQLRLSGDTQVVSDLAVKTSESGEAELRYTVGRREGRATLTVVAEADGAEAMQRTFTVAVVPRRAGDAVSVTIDATQKHQTVHGFGTFRNQVPVAIYAGRIGASAMRVGLIEEPTQIEQVNDNSDPRVLHRGNLNYDAFDWEHLRRLRQAGVETFILSSWSPPAWQKSNLSLNYQQAGFQGDTDQTDNRLDYYQYEEFAETMVAAVRMFKEEAGIDLYAIGLQNEPAFHEPYASAILDPQRFVELIKVVGRRFEREGIDCRLFMPEQVFSQTRSMNQYIDALNADAEAQKYCDVVATHGYDTQGVGEAKPAFDAWEAMYERSQGGRAKELWMTETYPRYRDWGSAFAYGQYLYGALEFGQIGLWTSWGIEGQLINQGQMNPSAYVFSQYARSIRPGAIRVSSQSPDDQLLVTSYLNATDDGERLATVLINRSDEPKAVRLNLRGHQVRGDLQVTRTDPVARAEPIGAVQPDDLILLTPHSVTTVAEKPSQ